MGGAYLHWDELRHRAPPDGLTHEQWWVRVKLARQVQYKQLPLLDKHGQPFVISVPETVQIDLHHIDRDAAGQIAAVESGLAVAVLTQCSAPEHLQILGPEQGLGPLEPMEVAVYRSRESRASKAVDSL